MGFFGITDPSECDKPMPQFGDATPVQMLAHGAVVCCKSKKVDRAVCQVDQCISAMSLCFALHGDFDALSGKITNPKGMQRNDEGQLEGDCALAILNGVEGEVCCNGGMKELSECVDREVGDYSVCNVIWSLAFEPTFFKKAVAIDKAFQPGGYCLSKLVTTTQIQTPCENPSDFDAQKMAVGGITCAEGSSLYLPSSNAECNEEPDGIITKADMTKILYAKCCKLGSKPNPICGLQSSTATPCESKIDGEFLPAET